MGNFSKVFLRNSSSSPSDDSNKRLSKILVKNVMTKQIIIVPSSTTVYQISKMMEQGIGSVLVKNDSIAIGIITDRDFAIKITANKFSFDTPVEKIASTPLHTIDSNQSLLDAAKQMSSKQIRKLVVIEDTQVVGIITSGDIIDKLSSFKKEIEI